MYLDNSFAFFMFAFGCTGITSIIVDGEIFRPFREYLKAKAPDFISKLLSCYQCSGFWVGLIFGGLLFWNNFYVESVHATLAFIFLAGGTSSALSYFWALYLTYLEANSLVNLDSDQSFDNNQEDQNNG